MAVFNTQGKLEAIAEIIPINNKLILKPKSFKEGVRGDSADN